ncbi:hypothetical protein AMS68_007989 [Peltaster fructicola]|uniref:Zn(2)-C6 fungal-type domain-containing protein n=1 Tax=Peltaster fructicola TaxID=286661 RepID=A0A6H0Y5Z3_9PEZI|nr:hypothetical protein AMS68_007989 [Peltaster fructicola]
MRDEADAVDKKKVVHRRYAPKTRTGCFTCKIRRVKCDEAKPFCNRCTSTGRKCDGYAVISPTSSKSPTTPSLSVALAFDVSTDALEKRTFDFFRTRTVPCVSGYFSDSVWDRLVLQVCHSEPAVRHAVNALGALHEERFLRQNANQGGVDVSLVQTSFPLKQYSKALSGLQALLNTKNVCLDLVILCSILCIHFEALRENFTPALIHADNAIRLLHGTGALDSGKVDPSLIAAMLRIDIQGSRYLGMRVPGLSFLASISDSEIPLAFNDLPHARALLNIWTCRLFYFMRTEADKYKFDEGGQVPIEVIAKSQELEKTFMETDTLLWNFMQKPNLKLTFREQLGLSALRARTKMNRILAACSVYAETTLYDAFIDDFDDILSTCKYVIKSENPDYRLFAVSIDEDLLHPLHFTASHCRDSRIRKDALAELIKLKGDHVIWHVSTLIKSAEGIIQYEESACEVSNPRPSDIPEWQRVHSLIFEGRPSSSMNKPVLKINLLTRPNGQDGEFFDIESFVDIDRDMPDLSMYQQQGDSPTSNRARDFGLVMRSRPIEG